MFALKCVLVSHSLVFGHPCVFVQLLSVVYPPHSLVCCRDKAQLGAALQRRTPHLQSSQVSNKCNSHATDAAVHFIIPCRICFSSFHGKKKQGDSSAGCCAIVNCDAALCAAAIKAYPVWVKFGGNLEDPAKSGVDGPCSKVLLVKGKAKPNQP